MPPYDTEATESVTLQRLKGQKIITHEQINLHSNRGAEDWRKPDLTLVLWADGFFVTCFAFLASLAALKHQIQITVTRETLSLGQSQPV